jgi:glyoxylase-like metal-dependent hydrolase (beta-lactamase superfamily II)
MSETRIHVIPTGRLRGNKTFLRADGWTSLVRRPERFDFPVYSFIVEHADGLIAIDTGLSDRTRAPRPRLQRRFVPCPLSVETIGDRMRVLGLDPRDVRRVVLTHLDWDHAGGLAHFPRAEVLVHRPEWEFARTFLGRQRYEPGLWPRTFTPSLYDLDPEPYGSFATSKAVTADGVVRLVPLPGHSIGQVGVAVVGDEVTQLFCADHILRQQWFLEDEAAGRHLGLGIFHQQLAVDTSRRIREFVTERPTVLLPSHDDQAPERLRCDAVVDTSARALISMLPEQDAIP